MNNIFYLLISLLVVPQAFAQLLIAPTRFVLDAEQASTEKVIVENTGETSIRLEIKPIYLPLNDEHSSRMNNDIKNIEDIARYVQISPPIIRKLKPNQRRTIRVRLAGLPEHFSEGEYRAYLHFAPTALAEAPSIDSNENSSAFNLDIKINSYIPIYVQKGTQKSAQQNKVKITCLDNKVKIENHSKFQFNAWLNTGETQEKLVLLRETMLIKPLPANKQVSIQQGDNILKHCKF
ncbi:molecular chaperone [Vibrio sinensis]|uniref:Molecular chaperone n=1 Tax=Vibrio sinensis TaxID=2302434 RepID=A0A3A6QS08_9VIBR|nr:molecular chaperone [Vibrio sinensis]RJX75545.1 molecular chaperone [Vibrio sinensis]